MTKLIFASSSAGFLVQEVTGHLLDIRLIFSETTGVLPVLLRYSSQWRNVRLTLDSSDIMALRTVRAPFASSTNLTVAMPAPKLTATATAFCKAPSLREVSLSGVEPLQSVARPCSQFTNLKPSNMFLETSLTILKATPNLELMSISVPARFPWPAPSALMLARLHTLTTDSSGLLRRLTLPAIKTLRLPSLTSDWVVRLLRLGTRSSWSPRSKISENVELLACPGYGTITFVPVTFTPLIAPLTTDDAFLPNPCELTIHDYPADEIMCSGLVEILASRSSLRLKSFYVSFAPTADVALDEVISRLRAEGG
ncbi:hypothetical protein MSAN_01716100 [Mycena sanguinolenta]|uniref:Uncharacterized protein n=1 Tax=Mycena sanguinolenta TaxID=230812 RepID=A0A8H6XZJ0_9AGAR|nr:hypothetical protein MSAN_01716100 [Mycena sanguinolenta]